LAGSDLTYVVIGGGQAGGRAVEGLRQGGFEGRVLLLGAERRLPYERPPLSKGVLTGAQEPEAAAVHDADWYRAHEVETQPGTHVSAIDRTQRRLHTKAGAAIGYDRLLLATGSRPVVPSLPGIDLDGVGVLRDADDSLRIRDALAGGARVVRVGGGYIGLEVAAAAAARGCAATVLEAADTVMGRQVAPELGAWYRRLHEARGVRVETGAKVRALSGSQRVEAVETEDGRRFDADLVVLGVGIRPNVELAEAAGLSVDDGIRVDETGATDDPDVFAAGDVTNHPNPILGCRLRLESWQNAQNQGLTAGRAMAGDDSARYAQLPWFWSDQHGINLQMLGMPDPSARLVWRGDPEAGPGFTLFYLDAESRLTGVNAVDRPGDIAPARRMMESRMAPDADALADPSVSMKKLLKGKA
jgi:3-phenylpropionate/trans-cinnamate dioxygenase ferredoxin reductase subunit